MADNFDSSAISWWNSIPAAPRTTSSSVASIIDHPNIVDSSIHSNFSMDYWNQSLLTSSSTSTSTSGMIRAEPSFHAMLQEYPMVSSYPSIESSHPHHFLLDHNHQKQSGFPTTSQGLFESQLKTQQPIFNQGSSLNNYHTSDFWNTAASSTNFGQVIYPSVSVTPAVQFGNPSFEQKPSCRTQTTKSNSEGVSRKSGSGSSSSSTEVAATTAPKKPRIQTPSPLPTFKVRKEKLGDRITALQQLVSPFGKTDTASVLHEAIDYIRFLHDQVNVLSTPYLKNGYPMQHQQSTDKHPKDEDGHKQDLRSRGLCLVPIECTYPVASETMPDFWTPSFGGNYRFVDPVQVGVEISSNHN